MTLDFLIDEPLLPALEQVPVDAPQPKLNTREEIFAAANTAALLHDMGDDEIKTEEEDAERAREIFTTARVPTKHEQTLPGVMLHLEALLSQYDYQVIQDAQQIRTYVTNRLLEETADPDPKIRLRAYELLGKISDVGLFTERQEVTVRHQSTEQLEDVLRAKLSRLIEGEAEVVETRPAPQALTVSPDEILEAME